MANPAELRVNIQPPLPGVVPETPVSPVEHAQPLSKPAGVAAAGLGQGLGLSAAEANAAPLVARDLQPIDLDEVLKEAGIARKEVTDNARALMQIHTRDYMKFLLFKAGDRPFDPADCEALSTLKTQLEKQQTTIQEQQNILDTPTETIMQRFDSSRRTNSCLFYTKVTVLALAAVGTIAFLFVPSEKVSSDSSGQGVVEGAKILVGALSGSAATLGTTLYGRRQENKAQQKRNRAEAVKTEARVAKAAAERERDVTLEQIRGKLHEIRQKINASCGQRLSLDYVDATPYQERPDNEGIMATSYAKDDLNRFAVQQKALTILIRDRLGQSLPAIMKAMKEYIPIEDSSLQPAKLLERFIAATGQIVKIDANKNVDSRKIRTFQGEWRHTQNDLLDRLRLIKMRSEAARPGTKIDISFLDTQSNRNNLADFPLSCLAIAPDSVKAQLDPNFKPTEKPEGKANGGSSSDEDPRSSPVSGTPEREDGKRRLSTLSTPAVGPAKRPASPRPPAKRAGTPSATPKNKGSRR